MKELVIQWFKSIFKQKKKRAGTRYFKVDKLEFKSFKIEGLEYKSK
ncbi:hypothetical protein GMA92_10925 [Turicibacter sanguinis]|uniref:Uncharacterized protein n=1 Tax=Turicibacter sanguinis TaxID=154288 RepID=A0A9X5AP01_9FIRM|nr:hypothetical protein [Turicibacter sanguinis]MDB8575345.1 hypothetical protein [Turicibacter sanguinis]MDB8577328.1 hypothetical protein [Turicibacter sanguinis]MDB8584373.1 hypothetical protein [Turicibacter sanguinis]MDB8586864.1 hypothetical protein [Turicibacter sanguinis]MDB8597584.1 hypothetical protein [Turicibacter sanguinis]